MGENKAAEKAATAEIVTDLDTGHSNFGTPQVERGANQDKPVSRAKMAKGAGKP